MNQLAASCLWADSQVLCNASLRAQLGEEAVEVIHTSNHPKYLDTLARALCDCRLTDELLVLYEPLIPDLLTRRYAEVAPDDAQGCLELVACSARIIPAIPCLHITFAAFFQKCHNGYLGQLAQSGSILLTELDADSLVPFLTALFRLYSYNIDDFSDVISPTQLAAVAWHVDLSVRYLALRCLALYMKLGDAATKKLLSAHLSETEVFLRIDHQRVRGDLLNLKEEQRWADIFTGLKLARNARAVSDNPTRGREVEYLALSQHTANLAGILLPIPHVCPHPASLVMTLTTERNLRRLAQALLTSDPVLMAGPQGSGKTLLVNEAAKRLSKLDSMVTLYLNEQTDSKSLLGIYTSSQAHKRITWHPGVLTRAALEGRWLLIEQIDRVPPSIMSIVLSLIENGEVLVPGQRKKIRAAPGFRLLATIEDKAEDVTSFNGKFAAKVKSRLWNVVDVKPLQKEELQEVLLSKFPLLEPYLSAFLDVHQQLHSGIGGIPHQQRSVLTRTRSYSARDLFKWCDRSHSRLVDANVRLNMPVHEHLWDEMFKDGVALCAGHLDDDQQLETLTEFIARSLLIAPQRRQHLLKEALPGIKDEGHQIRIGRACCARSTYSSGSSIQKLAHKPPFTLTRGSLRSMEEIAVAVEYNEPVLLVGETGVGKTAIVQHLATLLHQDLIVLNLSQQSESEDLVGGLKPITARSVAVPMSETFDAIFFKTFSYEKNTHFLRATKKCIASNDWVRLGKLWQESVSMARRAFDKKESLCGVSGQARGKKRRKMETTKNQTLQHQWKDFEQRLQKFKNHTLHKEKNFLFDFVEGRLVQAVRNGGWVLLDEVNLASSDTLESISGLLCNPHHTTPSLLIPEAGEIKRIQVHPDFRLFAAMNPATDINKRELPQEIRTRFTELLIRPLDSSIQELSLLITTYLGDRLSSDVTAAHDLATCYLDVRQLNNEKRLVDGSGQTPHYSLRSLVRTLVYVMANTSSFGLRRALYEGFLMSFATMLNNECGILVTALVQRRLFFKENSVRSLLGQRPRLVDKEICILFGNYTIWRGGNAPAARPDYIITPYVERNLLNLARAVSARQFPILLQGPTSSGKTSMVEYLAQISGNQFLRVNNHEHTDLQEYLGAYASNADGQLQYMDGVLVRALRYGYWIVLDELNLAPSDVLEALNRLLDDNRELLVPETQEVIRPHPNFVLFATQNPAGLYGGRKHLSRAFRNRFIELHVDDIPHTELEQILRERSHVAPSFCTKILNVYEKLTTVRQSNRLFEHRNSFATLRDLFRWALRPADDQEQLAINGYMLLGERVRDPVEKQFVKQTIEEVFKTKINEADIYGRPTDGEPLAPHCGLVRTPAMKRLVFLVMAALKNNEPVLLVGETGSGKTQACQTVASLLGRSLHTLNAHSNLESSDLIGTQRPTRNKAILAAELRTMIEPLLTENSLSCPDAASIGELITRFEKIQLMYSENPLLDSIRSKIGEIKSPFAWTDGCLVIAMKQGEPFLLDEISLADDSVLERLNTVLEPQRSIFLAEKGATDASLISAAPGYQFLATMNPAGDYGKRELSPALRNRLTEIWVPTLSESDDILPILQARLGPQHSSFAVMMMRFEQWFRSMFDHDSSTADLRSLLAWADFLLNSNHRDLRLTFAHGASLVLIDSLGTGPTTKMSLDPVDVRAARLLCVRELETVLGSSLPPAYFEIPMLLKERDYVLCGGFRIPCGTYRHPPTDLTLEAPTTKFNLLRVVRGLQLRRPILLEGDPGVGKTALVEALAITAQRHLTRVNLSDQTDLTDLFGSDVPLEGNASDSFGWRDGPLLRAMQHGGWVLLDEMNLATQSVLEGLNSCFDHREQVHIAELARTFKRHPDFQLFATQNPHQQGGGRKGLPASFISRFTVIYAEAFGNDDLEVVCTRKYKQVPGEIMSNIISTVMDCRSLVQNRDEFGSTGWPWEINLRDICRWLDIYSWYSGRVNPAHFFDTILSQQCRTVRQSKAFQNIRNSRFSNVTGPGMLYLLSPLYCQIGIACFTRGSPSSQNHRPVSDIPSHLLPHAESLLHCVNQKWPVILVGESASGKSSLIRSLAALSGTSVVEYPVTGETDISDLIGGFEQHSEAETISQLVHSTREQCLVLILSELQNKSATPKLQHLLAAYACCSCISVAKSRLGGCLASLATVCSDFQELGSQWTRMNLINSNQEAARFVWSDGVLVDAVEGGHWLVLDNANTCNSAVLDRLNGLLEPGGQLTISEQHDKDGNPRVVRPHENFRLFLTMEPRLGELSRAMRNRAIEIHFDTAVIRYSVDLAPRYTTDAAICRLRRLALMQLDNFPPSLQQAVAEITVDTLSSRDLTIYTPEDLKSILHSSQSAFLDEFAISQQLPSNLLRAIRGFQQEAAANHAEISQAVEYWPFHPSCWQSIPSLNIAERSRLTASRLAWILESLRSIYRMAALLSAMANEDSSRLASLDSSAGPMLNLKNRSISMMQDLLSPTEEALMVMLDHVHDSSNIDWHEAPVATTLLYVRDMADVLRTLHLLPGNLFFCIEHAYQLVADLSLIIRTSPTPVLQSIARLRDLVRLHWGQSILRLWDKWHAIPVANDEQLAALAQLNDFMTRFDACFWRASSRQLFARMHEQLLEARDFILQDASLGQTLLQELQQVPLHKFPANSFDTAKLPHFREVFELLCQYRDLAARQDGVLASSNGSCLLQISLLAGRATSSSILEDPKPPKTASLAQIVSVIGKQNRLVHQSIWRHSIGLELFRKLRECSSCPLNRICDLDDELSLLSNHLSQYLSDLRENHAQGVKQVIYKLLIELALCHADLLTPAVRSLLSSSPTSRQECAVAEDISSRRNVFLEHVPSDHYFRAAWTCYLSPIFALLALQNENFCYPQLGASLVLFSLGALRLWVPDRPTDPAFDHTIEISRRRRQVADLETKIQALKLFRSKFGEEGASLRIEAAAQELRQLQNGGQPAMAVPRNREIPRSIQECNNVIIHNLLHDKPENIILSSVPGHLNDWRVSGMERSQANQLLRQNLAPVLDKLLQIPLAYSDLTIPTVQLLHILDAGASMLDWSDNLPLKSGHDNLGLSKFDSIPLLGASPISVARILDINIWNSERSPQHLHGLNFLNKLSSRDPLRRRLQLRQLQSFEYCYSRWKVQLHHDQAEAIRQTKLYQYRRNEEDDEISLSEDEGIEELFPGTVDQPTVPKPNRSAEAFNSKSNAITMADLHLSFSADQNSQESGFNLFSQHLKRAISNLCSDTASQTLSAETLLPAIFLELNSVNKILNPEEIHWRKNVYRDADIPEARKLQNLLLRIEDRVSWIHQKWPEHATLAEILVICRNLGGMGLSAPLSRLLCKTEGLHHFLNEWEGIASREYSLAQIIQEVTALIIKWRQYELSSWSHLLEDENVKSDEDAKSWWFWLYQALVSEPNKAVREGKDHATQVLDLTSTLIDFLHTASLGQYHRRIDMLKMFHRSLPTLVHDAKVCGGIHSALSNIIDHFERYGSAVKERLNHGKEEIGQEVREQIKLASWKDTNVTSLRENARRSHCKLFRTIKRYRAILGQNVSSCRPAEFAFESDSTPQPLFANMSSNGDSLNNALATVGSSLKDWWQVPDRLRMPIETSVSMKHLYERSRIDLDIASALCYFVDHLTAAATELQSQTPTPGSDKANHSLLAHLKTRKRRLLAETLHDVRRMGIRRNLDASELLKQNSLKSILATVPDIPVHELLVFGPDLERSVRNARNFFHGFLDHMNTARTSQVNHHEDLTNLDVRKCVGSLEGLLLMVQKQRVWLKHCSVELVSLQRVRALCGILNIPDCVIITEITRQEQRQTSRAVTSLSTILPIACEVLKAQSRTGPDKMVQILDILISYSTRIQAVAKTMNVIIQDGSHVHVQAPETYTMFASCRNLVSSLRADLESWTSSEPNVAYLTSQLLPWTDWSSVPCEATFSDEYDEPGLDGFKERMFSIIDAILSGLQTYGECSQSLPHNTEQQAWLQLGVQGFFKAIDCLRISEIATGLSNLASTIPKMNCKDHSSAIALFVVMNPVIQQFYRICEHAVERYVRYHRETCRAAHSLIKLFNHIAAQGFCEPIDSDSGQGENFGQVENGTDPGLGSDIEDVSKEIGENEDLSELTAQRSDGTENAQLKHEEDAIDMGRDDMQGQTDELGQAKDEAHSEQRSHSGASEDEIDEEAASIDPFDPSAVDEKLWQGLADEQQKNVANENVPSQRKEKNSAADVDPSGPPNVVEDETSGADITQGEESIDASSPQPSKSEPADTTFDADGVLELPDELQLDGDPKSRETSEFDMDLDQISDVGSEKPACPQDESVSEADDSSNLTGDDRVEAEDSSNSADSARDSIYPTPVPERGDFQSDEVAGEQKRGTTQNAPTQEGKDISMDAEETPIPHTEPPFDAQNGEAENAEGPGARSRPKTSTEDSFNGNAGAGGGSVDRGSHDVNDRDGKQDKSQTEMIRKLGDVLEKWHRQRKEILKRSEDEARGGDTEMVDADFEHVKNEQDHGETQALGAANEEEARKLDESKAIGDEYSKQPHDAFLEDLANSGDESLSNKAETAQQEPIREVEKEAGMTSKSAAANNDQDGSKQGAHSANDDVEDKIEEADRSPPMSKLTIDEDRELLPFEEASRSWSRYSNLTHPLALILTEQLRLILAPTQATKLRGDFRSGKRLNLKRIIPYVASDYRRDKIWMRRSVPSKRNYKIMIAVDDSKSMTESGAHLLAFETLALLCKSLSMLDVGEFCVVSFGHEENIRVAHRFDMPFINHNGPMLYQNFTFQQRGTNVKRLIQQSIDMFREAKAKSSRSSSSGDTWQLELIISDGICEDHDIIRRLVREATEERIMIVFVIVDNNVAQGHSILDLTQAVFESETPGDSILKGDINEQSEARPMKLKMKKYLDDFPFPYYVIVRRVADLPDVLATALKGWFGEVVETA